MTTNVDIAPLAMFRVLFGGLMFIATIRFAANGWINELYVEPLYFFSYFGFEWLPRPSELWTYIVFATTAISSLMVCFGVKYRWAIAAFFLSFTYIELLDLSNYLNHYYFVSVVAFAMIFLPAANAFSLDARKDGAISIAPRFLVFAPHVLLGIVYVFAGIAKINSAWLLEANPLAIWLPQYADFPLFGEVFSWKSTAYVMSWGGMIYDLSIVFFLFWKKTRKWAYVAGVIFHLLTWWLFPIGMFPFIMIGLTLVFFSSEWHQRVLTKYFGAIPLRMESSVNHIVRTWNLVALCVLIPFFILQFLLPFRSALYTSDLYWAEEGYRFSWRVMLMEKAGHAYFYVKDPNQPGEVEVNLGEYLMANQIKQMCTQPDMILQFAHHIEEVYQEKGIADPQVRAEVWVTLNGEGSKLLIDPNADLTLIQESFEQKDWILPRANQNWLTDAN